MPSTSDLWAQALQDYKRVATSPTSQLTNFDPMAYLTTYGQGVAGAFNDTLNTQLRNLKGSAVGAGRLNTGFYDQDVGTLAKSIAGQYTNQLEQGAMQAAGMKLGATEQAASEQEDEQNRWLDMVTGQLDREQARKNQVAGQQSSLLSTVGTVAGAALPFLLSDERYKEDAEPIEGASERLRRIPAYHFRYRGDDEPQVGVMAQDVEREVPEAVRGGGREPMMVDYLKLVPMTIAAVREQGDEIRRLRGELHGGRAAA